MVAIRNRFWHKDAFKHEIIEKLIALDHESLLI